jgi:hypothetical protein
VLLLLPEQRPMRQAHPLPQPGCTRCRCGHKVLLPLPLLLQRLLRW